MGITSHLQNDTAVSQPLYLSFADFHPIPPGLEIYLDFAKSLSSARIGSGFLDEHVVESNVVDRPLRTLIFEEGWNESSAKEFYGQRGSLCDSRPHQPRCRFRMERARIVLLVLDI
jgi:hypothetical protein